MSSARVVVVGGGLAGLAASVPLADRGFRVSLLERHPRLGGRATSYLLPSGEHIDNCQHVTLRCCTNLEDFYRRIGVAEKIRYYDRLVFSDSKGSRGEIRPSGLPAPFHTALSFASFGLLTWKDKFSIARAMLAILRAGGKPRLAQNTSMLDWLKQTGQTQNAIDRFWRVVLVSALNEELDRTDAAYGIDVFWKAFISNRIGFAVGIPSVPLEALYDTAADRIKSVHGDVRTRCGVAELHVSNGSVEAVRLDDGSILQAEYYVLAIPFDRVLKIIPAELQQSEPFANLRKLTVSPITSVHLWFEREVMTEPFLTSVDQTIQWIFNRTKLSSTSGSGQYLQIVISASHGLAESSQQDIINLCRRELADLIPATREARTTRSVVVRENAATFSPAPGADNWRPTERTPIRNLLLAGDWTRTGWPATMEGAVRSGYRAAEAILKLEGEPAELIQRDLPVSGLARWLGTSNL
jgi:squalene-associated FAD-dependent desaturase